MSQENVLLEDKLEPLAREIAHTLVASRAPIGSSWADYHRDEDLIAFGRKEDDLVEYVRSHNHEARLHLFNIREMEPDLDSIVIHPTIVLDSVPRATASVEIDNLKSRHRSEPYIWTKEFSTGESELEAIEAGWEHESWGEAKASGGVKGIAEGEASAGFRDKLSASWSRQTGKTKASKTGGQFALVADPRSRVMGFLQWAEQTLQRRIECDAKYDFGMEIGRRRKYKRRPWRWTSGSPQRWDSLEHLLAVMERRGSVHHALYEHFSHQVVDPIQYSKIEELRLRHIDRLTPTFKGADGIRVVIDEVDSDVPE